MHCNKRVLITVLISFITFFSFATYAHEHKYVTIINRIDNTLKFTLHINPDVLPDYPSTFTLAKDNGLSSRVIDLQKRAYVRVEDNNGHSAYWGVKIENNAVNIHGYISKGIAFSWTTQSVIFCTPEEYKKNHGCS